MSIAPAILPSRLPLSRLRTTKLCFNLRQCAEYFPSINKPAFTQRTPSACGLWWAEVVGILWMVEAEFRLGCTLNSHLRTSIMCVADRCESVNVVGGFRRTSFLPLFRLLVFCLVCFQQVKSSYSK